MVEQTTPFRNIKEDAAYAIDQVKAEADDLVDALDFQLINQKIREFGRKNPIGLAVASLLIGVAAGMLVRRKTLD